eukprot:4283472-Alexandrium_andersonii.AAC.1
MCVLVPPLPFAGRRGCGVTHHLVSPRLDGDQVGVAWGYVSTRARGTTRKDASHYDLTTLPQG